MYILHIETSTAYGSVALSQDAELVGFRDHPEGKNHAEVLAPAIEDLLHWAGLKPRDLGAISVSSGPGSYTGLRVGSSTAKAMAYSLDKPLIPVPTLMALAMASFNLYPEAGLSCPMLDARRNEVYLALYDRAFNMIIPVSSVLLDEDSNEDIFLRGQIIVCCGDGAHKLGERWKNEKDVMVDDKLICHARHLIPVAWEMMTEGKYGDPMFYVPQYLKPANITQPRHRS